MFISVLSFSLRFLSGNHFCEMTQLGANKSSLVTSVASLVWLPVYDEWDGDVYTGPNAREMEGVEGEDGSGVCKRDGNENGNGEGEREFETGQVVFKGDKLPWSVGTYEVSRGPSFWLSLVFGFLVAN